ncbi:uncharacterized protein [Amphiura filiformis]|uniref:uncharacterized protein n=1 Tax=Amphiura filiformis TaxID=82378 RepID=UPI003B221F19
MMELFKIGVVGMLVLVVMHSSFACQCERDTTSLEGAYCHRLTDENQNTALVQAEICHKEFDDGFAEHFMVIKDVYLEPLMFAGTQRTIMPAYNPSCNTVPRAQQIMLLTSRENRQSACGIPRALFIGRTYVMEIIYSGAQWDITSCGYHKEMSRLRPAENLVLQNFKNSRSSNFPRNFPTNLPTCPIGPAPNRRQ